MTSSVPDSFNPEELAEMLKLAPKEEDLGRAVIDNSDKEITQEFIEECAEKALDYASELCSDPLVHKVMMMTICCRMIGWHTQTALNQFEDDEVQSGTCWMRDAGKFQAIMDSLVNISVGPNDFTCEQNDE